MELKKRLGRFTFGVKPNYPLSQLTSFQVGGTCDYLVRPANLEELALAVQACRQAEVYYKVVGNGTNLLVKDGGIKGVVIHIGEPFAFWEQEENGIKAGAAISLPVLSREVAEEGWRGLEFASGIPGSLGGALVMNAGAYGKSLGDLVEKIIYLEPWGEVKELSSTEIDFSYRWSSLREKEGVVVEAYLSLQRDDPGEILRRVEEILSLRRCKQPSYPSAGSVFKNPSRTPAGQLIEEAGCKGMRVGDALVSYKHANFIVNIGRASAADILELVARVQKQVKEKTGIQLQMEIEVIGEEAVN